MDFCFRRKELRFRLRSCEVKRGRKWDKKNRSSWEICPGALCAGHPTRRQSSEGACRWEEISRLCRLTVRSLYLRRWRRLRPERFGDFRTASLWSLKPQGHRSSRNSANPSSVWAPRSAAFAIRRKPLCKMLTLGFGNTSMPKKFTPYANSIARRIPWKTFQLFVCSSKLLGTAWRIASSKVPAWPSSQIALTSFSGKNSTKA